MRVSMWTNKMTFPKRGGVAFWRDAVILGLVCLAPQSVQAQALPATITWTGNTFGGAAYTTAAGASGLKHVQLQVNDMVVDTDGTVFTDSEWDENGLEAGIYKNGDVIGNCQDLSHGWGRGGGLAVTIDASYVYAATTQNGDDGADTALNSNGLRRYPNPGTAWFCIRRFHKDGSDAPFASGYGVWGDMMIINQATKGTAGYPDENARGLAVSGSSLYVSDPYNNRIAVYNTTQLSGTPSSSWTVTAPGKIVFDGSQKLWVLQSGSIPVLVCYSASGQLQSQQITFAATMTPSAIAWNAAASRLMVTDKGINQNITLYNLAGLSGTPTVPASTFGVTGGIHAGTDGQTGPLRFFDPVGVGSDAGGNLYVANSTGIRGGALSLESYTSSGGANWASPLQCLEFVNCADADPLSDTDIYSNDKHYTFDYSRPAGQGWTFAGLTVNRYKYPDDPRQHADFSGGTWVRRINGIAYLFLTQQIGGDIGVVRLSPSTDGEAAIPYAFINGGYLTPDSSGWPAGQPGTAGSSTEWIWRDANGNGKIDAGEYVSPAAGSPAQLYGAGWGQWVDQAGDIWQCGGGHVRHLKMHLDASGRPAWDYAAGNVEVLSPPALPNGATWQHGSNPDNDDMDRLEYQPGTDTMYVSGFTTAYPDDSGAWGGAGRVVYRYDNWNGARTIHAGYPVQLSWGTRGNMAVKSISVEGDYLFAVQAIDPETVTVYALDTGAKVGTMAPDASIGSRSGWVDVKCGLRAHRRASGEYIIFVEEDLNEKALMYRWTPPAVTSSLAGTVTTSTARANLTTEGTLDWIHWGDGSLTRKSGGGSKISTYTTTGGAATVYSNDLRGLSWTGGTPTASATASKNGLFISGNANGFSFTAPAGTPTCTLTVHVGGWASSGTLTAHLSDGSAADYKNTTAVSTGQYDCNYTLTYKAASAGQSLLVTWVQASSGGNVALNGAALK